MAQPERVLTATQYARIPRGQRPDMICPGFDCAAPVVFCAENSDKVAPYWRSEHHKPWCPYASHKDTESIQKLGHIPQEITVTFKNSPRQHENRPATLYASSSTGRNKASVSKRESGNFKARFGLEEILDIALNQDNLHRSIRYPNPWIPNHTIQRSFNHAVTDDPRENGNKNKEIIFVYGRIRSVSTSRFNDYQLFLDMAKARILLPNKQALTRLSIDELSGKTAIGLGSLRIDNKETTHSNRLKTPYLVLEDASYYFVSMQS
ncbi:hypothetical protein [Propionimicrobium lymphophilum]|uniref:hypothetical protein n=1 Tax=Propionimicrobium lymphophilum TaxID=33012 RepID=UPI003EC7F957